LGIGLKNRFSLKEDYKWQEKNDTLFLIQTVAGIQSGLQTRQVEKVDLFTHHRPTFLNDTGQYKRDVLDEGF